MPKHAPSQPTVSRKKQHVDLTLSGDVGFRTKTTGLEHWEFLHNALPEIDLADIDTSVRFLEKTLAFPLLISSMTGGYPDALRINRRLAEACQSAGIGMGLGSQRQALENDVYHRTFSVVREAAPSIPVIGNLGAVEVARLTDAGPALRLVELIGADAFAVHLNPLQELLQPEGSPSFRGVLSGIEILVAGLPVPVIVKEVGAGLSAGVVRRLVEAGVTYIDIAGAGGTSWAGVEMLRRKERPFPPEFREWGVPTASAVQNAAALKGRPRKFTLIASGGISNGLESAKCIALGADCTAAARPLLAALHRGGPRELRDRLEDWQRDFRGAMFLTGSRTVADLQRATILRREEV